MYHPSRKRKGQTPCQPDDPTQGMGEPTTLEHRCRLRHSKALHSLVRNAFAHRRQMASL
jgi:hypothetical protein